jgi:epoxyqueuosine reductase
MVFTLSTQSNDLDSDRIKQKALELGFHKAGIAAADEPPPQSSLTHWLTQGYHADMMWMTDPKRQDIHQLLPEVESVICVALNYYTPHDRPTDPQYAKISRYGWGRDYHRILHKKLKALTTWLTAQGDHILARYCADTAPIQDKVWAEKAGIGWIAKNSNVITREYGSWVFLGEVLTNLQLTCTRCIDACPTEAIAQPFVIDANRCIAYHTIENRAEAIPEEIANQMQGWVAGCDICQDVCPWNQRFAQETDLSDFHPYPWNIAPTLEAIASQSSEEWNQRLPSSALRRIKPEMWRRNAKANLKPGDSSKDEST